MHFLFAILLSSHVFGAEQTPKITVRQLLPERQRAVIQFAGEMKVGDEVVATFPDGKQCAMKLTAIKGQLANIATTNCEQAANLKVGQELDTSLAIEESPAEVVVPQTPVATQAEPAQPQVPSTAPTQKAPKPKRREISDLLLMPKKGRTVAGVAYSSGEETEDIKVKATSLGFAKVKQKTTGMSYDVSYGVSDQFAVGLGIEQRLSSQTDATWGPASASSGVTTQTKSSGWGDPMFVMGYRIDDQVRTPFILGVTLGYSPKGPDKALSSTTKGGNAKRGGDETLVYGEFGQKFLNFAYAVRGGAIFLGSTSEVDAADTSDKYSSAAESTVFVNAQAQIKVGDIVYVRGTFQQNVHSDSKWTSADGSTETKTESYVQPHFGIGLVVTPDPKSFAFSVGVDKTLAADVKATGDGTEFIDTAEGTSFTLSLGMGF